MSDDLDFEDGSAEYTLTRKDAKRLQREAKEGREATVKLATLEKERAFVQAGVPIGDKRASYFIAGYSGETTPEAIKARWDEDFGPVSDAGLTDPLVDELGRATELTSGGSAISPDRLAERDAKFRALSQTDPHYGEKFDAIFAEYGGTQGSLVG